MKIIIAGYVDIDPEQMDKAIAMSKPLIEGALSQEGCLDYGWCPDPMLSGRIRIFERWASEEALKAHFDNRWYADMRDGLGQCGPKGADVLKYRIDLAEAVYDETGTVRADFFTEQAS